MSAEDPYVRERILNLALEVSAAESLNQIITRVLSRVDELLAFDLTSIALLNEERSNLIFMETNYRTPGQGGTRSLVGQEMAFDDSNVFGWVAKMGRPHLRRSLEEPFAFNPLQSTDEVDSHIIVPIIGRREILGVLAIGAFEAQIYDEVDMAIAAQYARLTGLAIDNLHTYEKVSELALRDGLTGAYNHRHFQDVLASELNRLERHGEPLSILLLDVDDFKAFNDRFGHPEGDRVLKQTVQIIDGILRSSDWVFRYGGEEFAVVLPSTNLAQAVAVAEKLVLALRKHNHYRLGPNETTSVTASIGVSEARRGESTRESLIAEADTALYQAKGLGKDRAVKAQRETPA